MKMIDYYKIFNQSTHKSCVGLKMIEKRRLGRTGHMSSIVTFGGVAISGVSQDEADTVIELALSHGVNHIDVAQLTGTPS